MSSEIEYCHLAFAYDGQKAHATFNELALKSTGQQGYFPDYGQMDCAVTFVESGSTNCFDSLTNKRARSWKLEHCGFRGDCMRRVIEASVYAEDGSTLPLNRHQKAESFIAAGRKRLKAAIPLEVLFRSLRGSTLEVSLHDFDETKATQHPWWKHAIVMGWAFRPAYANGGIRLPVNEQLDLECLFQTIPVISTGHCGTYGTPGYGGTIQGALHRLSSLGLESLAA